MGRTMARTPSQLRMRTATPGDAPRIAEIHMAAFGSNAMLHAQFRAPVIRRGLQISIENKALADIEDPKVTVLVVTYCDGKQSRLLTPMLRIAAPRAQLSQLVGTHLSSKVLRNKRMLMS